MPSDKRQTIRIGPSLNAFLKSGACAGSSVPKRLDLLASRFQLILSATKCPAWPIETWVSFLSLAKQTDLTQPGAIYALQGNAKALGESRLSYALESQAPAQQVLLMVIAERFYDRFDAPDPETLESQLEGLGYQVASSPRP